MQVSEQTQQQIDQLIEFVASVKKDRAQTLAQRYPTHTIKPRSAVNSGYKHVPFVDTVCETLLHKDGCGYLELNEFTYQVNCFAKTIFHRKKWSDALAISKSDFMYFVWDDWDNIDGFKQLTAVADYAFNDCADLLEYHKQFIYTDIHGLVSVEDMRELFDALVDTGIFLSKQDDLYQVYENVDIDLVVTDTKQKFHNNEISKLNQVYLNSLYTVKVKPKLLALTTRLNFIPKQDPNSKFEPLIVMNKFGDGVWFLPQFLVFNNKN